MVPCRLEFVEPMRRKVQIATDRTRDRLCFVVIIKAGKIPPAWVAAEFDQARANHDAKAKPSKKPDNENRWPAPGKRPSIEQRTKKDRQKAGLEQLSLPAVAVPDLPDVHDRHVHRPEDGKQNRIGVAAKNDQRQAETDPGRRSTVHYRKFRTKRASALAAFRQCASRVALGCSQEND